MHNLWRKYQITVPWLLLLCLWGGIYDFAAVIYALFFAVCLLFLLKKGKVIVIPCNLSTYGLCAVVGGYFLSFLAAADKGMAWIGVLRMLVPLLFWCLWCSLRQETRERIWRQVPVSATVLTAAALFCYFIPGMQQRLFRADRLGGVFQYSNTYAVFLLAALIVLWYQGMKSRRDGFCAVILTAGIVFCGSRSVLVFLIAVLAFFVFRRKGGRKQLAILAGGSILLCIAVQLVFQLDLGRLLELSLESSTLNGRFLYWQDGLKELLAHPLGLGYMGYYFLQPQFQTGNYTTKFVHNDLLQAGLDGGILAFIWLAVLIFANIFQKKNRERNRVILTVLLAHSLFDFGLQYMSMFCILVMCMDTDSRKELRIGGRPAVAGSVAAAAAGLYFSVAFGLSQAGLYQPSLAMYPGDTLAREAWMLQNEGGDTAEDIIRCNGMLASAYDCAARQHVDNGAYTEVGDDVDGMIRCGGYDMYYYNQAVYYMSFGLDQALKAGDAETAGELLKRIQAMPEVMEELASRTSPLAYRIYDKPDVRLEDPVQEYIDTLSDLSLE